MRRPFDPRWLLAAASLALVGVVALRDARTPGPGALHPVHRALPGLEGRDGCVLCHGADSTGDSMARACLECHDAIAQQRTARSGLHGALDPDAATSRCDHCHGEHHGGAIALVSDASFERAGFGGIGGYDHRGLDFALNGRHAALNCDACHERAFEAVLPAGAARFLGLSQTCTQCHDDPHAGEMPANCADCHGQSEAFQSVAVFEHPLSFPLDAPHDGLACSACHAPGELALSALASADVAASARDCVDCHQPDHSARFLARVEATCADCHGPGATSFTEVDTAVSAMHHDAAGFALDGAHAEAGCAACHDGGGAFSERFPGGRAGDCSACHGDVHEGAFRLEPVTAAASPSVAGTDCSQCHGTRSFRPVLGDGFDHGRWTGFALHGAHASAECAACHGQATNPVRSFGRVADTFEGPAGACSTCHDSPHSASFLEGTGCAECHAPSHFQDLLPGAFDHGDATGYALEGSHAEAACTVCHVPRAGAELRLGDVRQAFPGDPARCDTCHEGPHGDRFLELARNAEVEADCARCHVPTRFVDVAPGTFDHGEATGFVLDGAHAQSSCTSCHVPMEHLSTRLGRVVDSFTGDTGRCATCHQDPHAGTFDRAGVDVTVDGRAGCARCHTTASFLAALDFDHARWTGWPLDGAHAGAACSACHHVQPTNSVGRSTGLAAGRSCANCHADPHLGQFDPTEREAGCADCHSSTESFRALDFDHAEARFPLDARHAELDCTSCHRPARTQDGRTATRYRPIAHECADCHDPSDRRYRAPEGRTPVGRSGR